MLTTTQWPVTNMGRHFDCSFPGTCLLTGKAFVAGTKVRAVTISGQEGYAICDWVKLLDVRGAGPWDSRFSLKMDELEKLVADPEVKMIELMNHFGQLTIFRRSNGKWDRGTRSNQASDKQVLAQGRTSFAVCSKHY